MCVNLYQFFTYENLCVITQLEMTMYCIHDELPRPRESAHWESVPKSQQRAECYGVQAKPLFGTPASNIRVLVQVLCFQSNFLLIYLRKQQTTASAWVPDIHMVASGYQSQASLLQAFGA